MRKIFLLLSFLISLFVNIFAQNRDSLIFSEIMFYQPEPNCEFVEIYNFSRTASYNLRGLKIKYDARNPDSTTILSSDSILAPRQFAVIFEGDYDFDNPYYEIGDSVLVLKLTDDNFGSSGMSNSSDKTLKMILNSDTISVYTYSADNQKGYSDEKFILNEDNSASNWKNSLLFNGTPGAYNSVSPLNFDLALAGFEINSDLITVGTRYEFSAKIFNLGFATPQDAYLKIYFDYNRDSTITEDELFSSQVLPPLFFQDSLLLTQEVIFSDTGNFSAIAVLDFPQDENPANNRKIISLEIIQRPPQYGEVCINEIKYLPLSGEPEWIEIYNNSDTASFPLLNWKISDKVSSARIADSNLFIEPREFVVITHDDAILDFYDIPSKIVYLNLPSLNNSGDKIALTDNFGNIADSVWYSPEWNNGERRSLEKIEPQNYGNSAENWRGCENPESGTPGIINSVTQKDYDVKIESLFVSPQNALIETEVRTNVLIRNIGKNGASFTVKLYDVNPNDTTDVELMSSLQAELSAGDSQTFVFPQNLILNSEKILSVYADFPEDEDTTNNAAQITVFPSFPKNSLILNEILFEPQRDECEWIEVVNNSSRIINLKNWTINDLFTTPTTVTIADSDLILQPAEMFIFAKDSSFLDFHANVCSDFKIVKFPTLNNSSDAVVIKDANGNQIDSLRFFDRWLTIENSSLERILYSAATQDSANWGSSQSEELSTPGCKNSIAPKIHDLAIDSLFFSPKFPHSEDKINLSVLVENLGEATENYALNIYENDSLCNTQNLAISADSVSIIEYETVNRVGDSLKIKAEILLPSDENEKNNSAQITVYAGYPEKSLIISEFMPIPDSSGEWIEIYNNSGTIVHLSEIFIADSSLRNNSAQISNTDFDLNDSEFLVICSDSAKFDAFYGNNIPRKQVNFGSLNNSHDAIYLIDFRGAVIDSLYYDKSWQIKRGYSIEKIDLLAENENYNWRHSLDERKSTPGAENSVSFIEQYESKSVIINEIMFDAASGNSDFFEIYNRSSEPVNLGGWFFKTGDNEKKEFLPYSLNLLPNKYFVIVEDSNFINNYSVNDSSLIIAGFSLNLTNGENALSIYDFYGNLIDSVYYSPSWHNPDFLVTKNRSLERINPNSASNDRDNWSSSLAKEKATPAKQNSVFQKNPATKEEISISPNPFSPDNDGFEDVAFINYKLKSNINSIRVRIYDSRGRLVRTLADDFPSASDGKIIFDGRDKNGNALPLGIYILLFEEISDGRTVNKFVKPVVIARKL